MRDPFPEVKLRSFATLRLAVEAVPQGVRVYATALVRVAAPITSHRHAKVRQQLP